MAWPLRRTATQVIVADIPGSRNSWRLGTWGKLRIGAIAGGLVFRTFIVHRSMVLRGAMFLTALQVVLGARFDRTFEDKCKSLRFYLG